MSEIRIPPAGDGFYAASRHPDQETPHGCYEGFVYLGHMVEDEHGDEVEIFEAVSCKRCRQERG